MIENKQELLNKKIEELEAVLEILKKIRDNPGMGERAAIEGAGIDYSAYRRICYDASWMKKESSSVPNEVDVNKVFKQKHPTITWQEGMWYTIVGARPNMIHLAPLDVVDTIDYLIEDIRKDNPKVADVLVYRFRDHMTKAEVGEIMGLTSGRIGQIEANGMRMFYSRGKWMQFGKKYCISALEIDRKLTYDVEIQLRRQILNEINANIPPIKKLVEIGIKALNEEETDAKFDKDGKPKLGVNTAIEECDFSIRTFNALKRAGFNYISDILKVSDEDLLKVRNLGRKSFEEIMDKLIKWGLC